MEQMQALLGTVTGLEAFKTELIIVGARVDAQLKIRWQILSGKSDVAHLDGLFVG